MNAEEPIIATQASTPTYVAPEFPGVELDFLVRHQTDQFVVGIDKQGEIDWECSDKCEHANTQECAEAEYEATRLESQIKEDWTEESRKGIRRVICEMLAAAFTGNSTLAKEIRAEVERRLREAELVEPLLEKVSVAWKSLSATRRGMIAAVVAAIAAVVALAFKL